MAAACDFQDMQNVTPLLPGTLIQHKAIFDDLFHALDQVS
jgi:hypothetical protein